VERCHIFITTIIWVENLRGSYLTRRPKNVHRTLVFLMRDVSKKRIRRFHSQSRGERRCPVPAGEGGKKLFKLTGKARTRKARETAYSGVKKKGITKLKMGSRKHNIKQRETGKQMA